MTLLLLSDSRNPGGEFLAHALDVVAVTPSRSMPHTQRR